MSEKKAPPPPSMPPAFERKENYCLLHKGPLQGDLYTCVTCKAEYCLECAKKAKAEGKQCVRCKQLILVKL